MRDFKDLTVWQRAHELTLDIYKATERFPRAEMYGLTIQLRRAAISIGANISEGSARHSDAGMRQFLAIAHGSAAEVQYLLLVSMDLGYLPADAHESLVERARAVRRMLYRFVQRLSSAAGSKRRVAET